MINKFKLRDIVNGYEIKEQEFEYAGTNGIAEFTDSLYEDIIRYNYVISSDLFIAFGVKDNILSCLEIVADEKIIEEIISVRKTNDLIPKLIL